MFDALKHSVFFAAMLVVHAGDDLVSLTPCAGCVLASEYEVVCERGEEADANICKDYPVSKRVPRLILRTVTVGCHCTIQITAT